MQRKRERIEGNNRMGKTRDLFKKIRDTKGIFHAKMGTIKERNGIRSISEPTGDWMALWRSLVVDIRYASRGNSTLFGFI